MSVMDSSTKQYEYRVISFDTYWSVPSSDTIASKLNELAGEGFRVVSSHMTKNYLIYTLERERKPAAPAPSFGP